MEGYYQDARGTVYHVTRSPSSMNFWVRNIYDTFITVVTPTQLPKFLSTYEFTKIFPLTLADFTE